MTGYDFDKTIYDGDSFTRFYLYCLARFWYLVLLLPFQGVVLALFGLRIISRKRVKQLFLVYLWLVPNPARRIEKFWDKHIARIKPWYLAQKKEDDLLISASPEFLLLPLCRRLGITHLIASRIDLHSHRYTGENCYGGEKVIRLYEYMGSRTKPDAFYSDSLSDLPMMRYAGRGYLVTGNDVREINLADYRVRPKAKWFLDRKMKHPRKIRKRV